jgi:small conductance mechanosensitive channel
MKDFLSNHLLHYYDPSTLLGALVYAVIFLGLALFAARIVRISLKRATKFIPDTAEAIFVAQLIQVIVFLVAFILYAHLIPVLRSLGTALLTGASVASVVVGLASQSSQGNMIAGLSIFLFQRFRVGDHIQLNTPKGLATGTVEALALGYATLRTYENEEILVPNNVMVNSVIIRLPPKGHKE